MIGSYSSFTLIKSRCRLSYLCFMLIQRRTLFFSVFKSLNLVTDPLTPTLKLIEYSGGHQHMKHKIRGPPLHTIRLELKKLSQKIGDKMVISLNLRLFRHICIMSHLLELSIPKSLTLCKNIKKVTDPKI